MGYLLEKENKDESPFHFLYKIHFKRSTIKNKIGAAVLFILGLESMASLAVWSPGHPDKAWSTVRAKSTGVWLLGGKARGISEAGYRCVLCLRQCLRPNLSPKLNSMSTNHSPNLLFPHIPHLRPNPWCHPWLCLSNVSMFAHCPCFC